MTPVRNRIARRAHVLIDGNTHFITGSRRWAQDQVSRLGKALEAEVDVRTEELKAIAEWEHRLPEMLRRSLLCPDTEYRRDALCLTAATEATPREALVGGDFHDVFPLEGGRTAIVLGDICGKGLVAAVQVPAVEFALRAYLCQGDSPGGALARLNDFLVERVQLDCAQSADPVALTIVVLDGVRGAGMAAAAGANPLTALRACGVIEMIDVSGLPLGVLPEQTYTDVPVSLSPGEILMLTTDGVTEARHDGSMLYPEGTAQIALQAQQEATAPFCGDGVCFCQDLLGRIRKDVIDGARAFGGGAFRDDAAVILVRLCPGASQQLAARKRRGRKAIFTFLRPGETARNAGFLTVRILNVFI